MCNRKNEIELAVSKRMQNKLFHLTRSCATADGSCAHLDTCVVTSAWKSVNRQAGLVLRQTPAVSQCPVCALTHITGQSKYKSGKKTGFKP